MTIAKNIFLSQQSQNREIDQNKRLPFQNEGKCTEYVFFTFQIIKFFAYEFVYVQQNTLFPLHNVSNMCSDPKKKKSEVHFFECFHCVSILYVIFLTVNITNLNLRSRLTYELSSEDEIQHRNILVTVSKDDVTHCIEAHTFQKIH